MDDRDLTERLRALGDQPVSPATQDRHLRMLATATPASPPRRFGRLAVAAAAIVGFLAGSTGLAVAGALPDPAQDVAHDVLSVVQVDVPEGNRGACVSAAARDTTLTPEQQGAAKDACPKGGNGRGKDGAPGQAGNGETPGRSAEAPGKGKHTGDPCRGKPPWAGQKVEPAERDRLQAEHGAARAAAGCPADTEAPETDEAETEEPEGDERSVPEAAPGGAPSVPPPGDQAPVPPADPGAGIQPAEPPTDTPPAPPVEEPPAAEPGADPAG